MTQLRGQLNGCRPIEPEPDNTGGGNQEVNNTDQTKFKNRSGYKNPQILAEIAIFTALATVLSIQKIFHMPQGGSITLASMVPIIWLALRRGPKIGITTGVLYGIIQLIVEPGIINPIQVVIEYPIAFGVLGLASFFPNKPIFGATVAISVRFLMHFIAGAVWWAPIIAPSANPIIYSTIYNGTYLLPELAITGFIFGLLQTSNVLKAYL